MNYNIVSLKGFHAAFVQMIVSGLIHRKW